MIKINLMHLWKKRATRSSFFPQWFLKLSTYRVYVCVSPLRNWPCIPKCKTPRTVAAGLGPRGPRRSRRRTRSCRREPSTWARAASSSRTSRATSAPWWTNTSAEHSARRRRTQPPAATRPREVCVRTCVCVSVCVCVHTPTLCQYGNASWPLYDAKFRQWTTRKMPECFYGNPGAIYLVPTVLRFVSLFSDFDIGGLRLLRANVISQDLTSLSFSLVRFPPADSWLNTRYFFSLKKRKRTSRTARKTSSCIY